MTTTTPSVRGAVAAPSPLVTDLTFIARSLRHTTRNVDAMITALALPVIIMLLFVFIFGGAIETGTEYVDYVVPGIILLCAGFGASGTAIGVSQDKVTGVIDRFRTMPIRSSSVLTGHVVASVVRNLVSTALVVAVALLSGFRPDATAVEWLAATGLITLFLLAITWLATAVGLVARSVETAGAFGFVVMFVPYVSSAFVPTDTLPTTLHWLAEHQPVTPIIETLRGLLTGTAIGTDAWWAVGWCVLVLVISVAWASRQFRRVGRT